MTNNKTTHVGGTKTLPVLLIIGLALLAVPRMVAHDLELVGPLVNAMLVFAPPAVWVVVTLWKRVPRVFLSLLLVGLVSGVLLAVTHQLLWSQAFDTPPSLGGNFEGRLSPGMEELLLRTFAVGSSVVTGLLLGVVTAAVAWSIARVVPGFGSRPTRG